MQKVTPEPSRNTDTTHDNRLPSRAEVNEEMQNLPTQTQTCIKAFIKHAIYLEFHSYCEILTT